MKTGELDFLVGRAPVAPRVLIVSPHPDDEVIGAGTRLPLLRDAVIVQVTDGAPEDLSDALAAGYASRDAYAEARHRELREALGLCGLNRTIELHVPDQNAAFRLAALKEKIGQIIRRIDPDYVLTVPYEGGHPDHDATAFAVHSACAEMLDPPAILEMLSYHNERGYCEMDRFLNESDNVLTVELSEKEIALKRQLFDCFHSQARVLQWFPVRIEKFRLAPDYDFMRPPHDGQLYYELFAWGMTGARWRELVARSVCEGESTGADRNVRAPLEHELAHS